MEQAEKRGVKPAVRPRSDFDLARRGGREVDLEAADTVAHRVAGRLDHPRLVAAMRGEDRLQDAAIEGTGRSTQVREVDALEAVVHLDDEGGSQGHREPSEGMVLPEAAQGFDQLLEGHSVEGSGEAPAQVRPGSVQDRVDVHAVGEKRHPDRAKHRPGAGRSRP